MKIIYFLGKDLSIFESLENLSKIEKKFLIKKTNNVTDQILNNSTLIIDDSLENFINVINSFSLELKSNLIVTTKKENITITSLQNHKVFVKPIKILDLYGEIIRKVKGNINNFELIVNHSKFSVKDKKGMELKLTEKEFKLLQILLRNNTRALNKKYLLYNVWGMQLEKVESLDTRVLETLVSRIRKKINSSKINIKIIKNKSGYKIN